MSILTNWGYALPEADSLPDMLTLSEFNTFTAGRYQGDVRTADNISAASAAIRDYVGWHLYPSCKCELSTALDDRRVTITGRDLLIQLPTKFVTAITSVQIDGNEIDSYRFETNGILKIYDVNFAGLKRYTTIEVEYAAGLTDLMMNGIRELVANRVIHAVASSNGVTTEAAGGVSVTYNAGWVANSSAGGLQDTNKELLAPYRLQGVF